MLFLEDKYYMTWFPKTKMHTQARIFFKPYLSPGGQCFHILVQYSQDKIVSYKPGGNGCLILPFQMVIPQFLIATIFLQNAAKVLKG